MNVFSLSFEELSNNQLYDVVALRQQVFIIEQDCIYPDIDGRDRLALHLMMYDDETLVAYLRIFPPDAKLRESSLGRIVVHPKYRGGTMGKDLIQKGIDTSRKKFPDSSIRIEAQAELKRYYEKFGFIAEGQVYVVDGIDHLQMILAKT